MVTRRQFMVTATATSGALPALQACASPASEARFDAAARATWRHTTTPPADIPALHRELVRYATLAASSHNTQPWRFHIEPTAISILPDLSRRCPAVDPDEHHLFVSLGCATENLVQAALANGYASVVEIDPVSGAVRVALTPAPVVRTASFEAIPDRQNTRGEFDHKPLASNELTLLARAGTSDGIRVLMLTDRAAMERVLEHVTQANTAQMNDSAFVHELKSWVRYNRDDAVRTGDGLYSGAVGSPSVPAWLGPMLFDIFSRPASENDKYAAQVRSSAGIAVFVSDADDRAHWVNVGRAYQRFALQCTALGVRLAMLNQPVEVTSLRAAFATSLGLNGQRPDLVVRFGRGPRMPPSLRRAMSSVLV